MIDRETRKNLATILRDTYYHGRAYLTPITEEEAVERGLKRIEKLGCHPDLPGDKLPLCQECDGEIHLIQTANGLRVGCQCASSPVVCNPNMRWSRPGHYFR